jgi:hypothetical protein
MASDGDGGNTRHGYGSRPLAALLPPVLRPAFRRRAPATAQVLADWPAIVGPALAAMTTPTRLASGTLAIACSGPVALELQHLADELRGRINAHLGQVAVIRLRFVPAKSTPSPPPVPTTPAPAREAASLAVMALPPGDLRDALERLGRAVLTDRPADGTARPGPNARA